MNKSNILNISDLLKELESRKFDSFYTLKTFFITQYRNVRYNHLYKGNTGLILLNTLKLDSRELLYNFNGLIIHCDLNENTYKVIYKPIKKFYAFSKVSLDDKFKIYEILNGTVLGLYYYNDCWNLSSPNGIKMNNVKRNTEEDFEQLFLESGSKYNFTFDSLNKEYKYTFIMINKKLHVISENDLIVKKIDNANNEQLDENELKKECEKLNLKYQESVKIDVKSINEINENALKNYLLNNEMNFGYIVEKDNKSYLLDSSLMIFIRKYVFNIPNDKIKIEFYKLFLALNAYLNAKETATFIKINPSAKELYDTFDEFFTELEKTLKRIYDMKDRSVELDKMTDKEYRIIVNTLLNKLDSVKQNYKSPDGLKYIKDITRDHTYLMNYFYIITEQQSKLKSK